MSRKVYIFFAIFRASLVLVFTVHLLQSCKANNIWCQIKHFPCIH